MIYDITCFWTIITQSTDINIEEVDTSFQVLLSVFPGVSAQQAPWAGEWVQEVQQEPELWQDAALGFTWRWTFCEVCARRWGQERAGVWSKVYPFQFWCGGGLKQNLIWKGHLSILTLLLVERLLFGEVPCPLAVCFLISNHLHWCFWFVSCELNPWLYI